MHKVLITGITGFLGSHIAEILIHHQVQVIGLKRETSSTWRCSEFISQIDWVDLDEQGLWKTALHQKAPETIIHCAWIGVTAKDRDNWTLQLENVSFLADLLSILSNAPVSKFIFMGSQAEYGDISGKITEKETACATNAYSGIKLACHELLKMYCELNQVKWIWLRLFSVFGEKESASWLIPSMIDTMLKEKEMDFTPGNQKYAYLYVKDFAEIIRRTVFNAIQSGIYNVSSTDVRPLKSLITEIRNYVNPAFKLNFGALAYRSNQSLHIEGDISKLSSQIGTIEYTPFDLALQQTIAYYTSKQIKNESI